MRLVLSFLFLAVAECGSHSFNILVYNIKSGHSHASFMGRIADILVDAGHNVTTLVSVLTPNVADGTTKSKIIYVPYFMNNLTKWEFNYTEDDELSAQLFLGSSRSLASMLVWVPSLRKEFNEQCTQLLNWPGLVDKLEALKYDVVIGETFDFCGFGLAHQIKAKSVVGVSSTHMVDYASWHIGSPLPFSYLPSSHGFHMESYSLWERAYNLVAFGASYYFYQQMAAAAEDAFRTKYGPGFPSVSELLAESAFFLTAGEPLVDLGRPTLRKIVDIGGLGIRISKPLPKEYNDLLSLRPQTVVVSFGSVTRAASMPPEFKSGLAKAFARFPNVTFLWKYEEPENAYGLGIPDNVLLRAWLPQNDLLDDPRVVGLISHGGKTSISEAAEKGMPTIFVPIFGDQSRNGASAVHSGFGILMDKIDLADENVIYDNIYKLLHTESLHVAARKVKEILASRPFTSPELLIKHVEFAAKFGAIKALDPQGRHLPFYVYYNLDLFFIVLVTLGGAVYCMLYLFKIVLCSPNNKKSERSKKQKKL